MPFESAGTAEILRSIQKDDNFLEVLKNNVADIIQKTFGTEFWLKYHKWIHKCCELVYFSLTTLALRQTLGEEYSGLLLMNHDKKSLPSMTRRIIMVFCQCLGPMIFSLLLKKLQYSLDSGYLSTYLKPKIKNKIQDQLFILRSLPSFIWKLHLSTFYLGEPFYHLAKRITGIRYVLIRSWFKENGVVKTFRYLGFIVLMNNVLATLYSFWDNKNHLKETSTEETMVDSRKKCPLCLDRRKNPSVTPCGHLFCWNCIHGSLQTNLVCPICRYSVSPNQIVALMNYD